MSAAKKAPLLNVAPPELVFIVQQNKASKVDLLLSNPTNTHIAYKVKTTAPKRYCVRPTFGIIQPLGTEEIQVLLNFPKEKLPEEKDKFQILSLSISKEQATTDALKAVWASASEDDVMKQRLKCSIKIVGDLPTFQPTIPQIEPEGKQDVETRFHDASSFLTASSTKTQPIPIPNREEKVITASPLSSPTEASPGNTPDFQKLSLKLDAAYAERDQLLKEVHKLREELGKQKEETLRQRKITSTPESSKKEVKVVSTTALLPFEQQLPEQLQNRFVQYLVIALFFFILGKLL